MKLRMDPLLKHMTGYFDELLCDLDPRFRELDKEKKAIVLLTWFRHAGAARPTPAFGYQIWKATETVTFIIGRIARCLQPFPAPDEGPLVGLVIGALPDKRIWKDFIDGAQWAMDDTLEECLAWLRADLILVKKPRFPISGSGIYCYNERCEEAQSECVLCFPIRMTASG
jgi:hypothetical protein